MNEEGAPGWSFDTNVRDNFWRAIPLDVGASARHFALSDALARHAARPTVWWHETERPTLILGAGQPLSQVDLEACRESGVTVIRRQSGGTAVYAGPGVLGLDIALPLGHPLVLQDVVESYRWLGLVWLDALRGLGVHGTLVGIEEAREISKARGPVSALRAACFGTLSPYEVVVDDRKLIGLAQVRRRGTALLQSAAHLRFDGDGLEALLSEPGGGAVPHLRDVAVGLVEAAGWDVSGGELMAAVEETLYRRVHARLAPGDWTAVEAQHAREREPEMLQSLSGA